ncbi:hypothetical protein [Mycobacterium terramassiliense]|uniref:hypothetical protein n=1 Tax=Mycobacterium terramassiliense TaxID=1841859 RepID=UPI0012FFAF22|nr:hypothetical protein [Mycobacterium terramassiliense]
MAAALGRRRRARNGPHAGVESQGANVTAGPVAAMLDRARDAIMGRADMRFLAGR